MRVRRALLSVYDKTGIAEFAQVLQELDIEIISSGGTAEFLRENGCHVKDISEVTGFPEILDGRVKTIHPKIASGLLARRENKSHMDQIESLGIKPLDLVTINLYPFEQNVGKPDMREEDLVELIDIGGPTLIRAAAKNADSVAVLTSPQQYNLIAAELKESKGEISNTSLTQLRAQAFQHTANYDTTIARYFSTSPENGSTLPAGLALNLVKTAELRYGENPHQAAGYYQTEASPAISGVEQLHGGALSYNNLLDVDAAAATIRDFPEPTVAIIKHNVPCGIGSAPNLLDAYKKAFATDPISAFGGIMSMNGTFPVDLAREIKSHFLEVVMAKDYDPEALALLSKRKKLRILKVNPNRKNSTGFQIRTTLDGYLIQEQDNKSWQESELTIVSERQPNDADMQALAFAWRTVKHIRSNAIVFAGADRLLGVGAGQMSRVDSVELAIRKAEKAGLSLAGSSLASDAFFPFRDGVDVAADAGVRAIIQPGGSIRDQEVIDAADERDIVMVLTGTRHFKH